MLNQTGELKAARWFTMMCLSSARKVSASASSSKYPSLTPQAVMVSTTRSATCLSEVSRSGVPGVPRKYFWARMLVALRLHDAGTSTPSCSKATLPSR